MNPGLPSIDCSRSQNPLTNYSLFDQKLNHYREDRPYQFHGFSQFVLPYFPFWQGAAFYPPCDDQHYGYMVTGAEGLQAGMIKEEDKNEPSLPSKTQHSLPTSRFSTVAASESKPRAEEEPQRPVYREKRRRKYNSFYWTLQENRRYLKFVKNNRELFDLSIYEKKNMKVNVLMSYKVKSRSAQQCHSHHQKLVKKYGTIERVLAEFEKDMLAHRQCCKAKDREAGPGEERGERQRGEEVDEREEIKVEEKI